MLLGLRSRCTTPPLCAWAKPRATSVMISGGPERVQLLLRKERVEGAAFEMFHDQEGHSVLATEVEDTDDVLVTEARRKARFELEQLADPSARSAGPIARDELERYGAFECSVAGQVHDAHRTTA